MIFGVSIILLVCLGIVKAIELVGELFAYLAARHRRNQLYASTRHTLPRATARRLRAARLELHRKLINRA